MTLVFASSNNNKIREIKHLMPEKYEMLGLQDIGINHEIPETGNTIRENSFQKAKHVWDHLRDKKEEISVFADDSGLEVEALSGAPGVYSARYAGIPKNDRANNEKLLSELKDVGNRKARFVTGITLLVKNEIHYFEGEVKGVIALAPKGDNGFGYDPLFIPEGYASTFAELSPEIKNTISHRAMAVKQLIEFLMAG